MSAILLRAEAVKLIRKQFDDKREKPKLPKKEKYECYTRHYGICELRELLDKIYGGPPAAQDEELSKEES